MIYCYKTLQEKEVFQESVESFKVQAFGYETIFVPRTDGYTSQASQFIFTKN